MNILPSTSLGKTLFIITLTLSITTLAYTLLTSLTTPAPPSFIPQPLDLRGNPGLKEFFSQQQIASQQTTHSPQTTSQSSTQTLYERFTTQIQEQEGIIFQIFNILQAVFYSGTFYVVVMAPVWLWDWRVLVKRKRESERRERREREVELNKGAGKRKWDDIFEGREGLNGKEVGGDRGRKRERE